MYSIFLDFNQGKQKPERYLLPLTAEQLPNTYMYSHQHCTVHTTTRRKTNLVRCFFFLFRSALRSESYVHKWVEKLCACVLTASTMGLAFFSCFFYLFCCCCWCYRFLAHSLSSIKLRPFLDEKKKTLAFLYFHSSILFFFIPPIEIHSW